MKLNSILLVVMLATTCYAQEGTPISEYYLKGKWTASCAVEVIDHASFRHCELCIFSKDSDRKSRGRLLDIQLTFQNDSLTLEQEGKPTTVPYSRNKDNHSFSFTFKEKLYDFRVLLYNDQRIIEDADGHVLVLEKAEKQPE